MKRKEDDKKIQKSEEWGRKKKEKQERFVLKRKETYIDTLYTMYIVYWIIQSNRERVKVKVCNIVSIFYNLSDICCAVYDLLHDLWDTLYFSCEIWSNTLVDIFQKKKSLNFFHMQKKKCHAANNFLSKWNIELSKKCRNPISIV